jgi:transcriptional regulator with XRE-family HTH domain
VSQRSEWSAKITKLVADQVRHHRQSRGWSIQQLSNELAERGLKMDRPVLSNLENGRRPTLTVDEWLLIADTLEIPALLLLFPLGMVDAMEVVPGTEMSPWAALEWAEQREGAGSILRNPVELFRQHAAGVARWVSASEELQHLRSAASGTGYELVVGTKKGGEVITETVDPVAAAAQIKPTEEVIRLTEERITVRRMAIRDLDLTPPELPPSLAFLDRGVGS